MLSANFVSFITSMMSHIYSLTKNPTPPYPLSLGFCPSRFSPIHVYSLTPYPISAPLFSHNSWIPTISRSRFLYVFGYLYYFALARGKSTYVPRFYPQLPSRIIPRSLFVCCFLSVFFTSISPPLSLPGTYLFLLLLSSVYLWTTS